MSEEEILAIGALPEDFLDDSELEIWPENWEAVLIFSRMGTQWRVGMGGATGLDYTLLPLLCESYRVKRKQYPEILDKIQVMERHALSIMSSEGKQK